MVTTSHIYNVYQTYSAWQEDKKLEVSHWSLAPWQHETCACKLSQGGYLIALFLLLPLSQQKWSDLPHDLASAEIPRTHFSVVPQRWTKGNEAASIYLKYGMKIIAGSCSSCKCRSSPLAQHGLHCLPRLSAVLSAALSGLYTYLFIYAFIYLFGEGQSGGRAGEGGGGVYVIAVYTAFPRYYCLWLCFLFPSRVLISWSCWLAGRRVSGVKAERSLPGGI